MILSDVGDSQAQFWIGHAAEASEGLAEVF